MIDSPLRNHRKVKKNGKGPPGFSPLSDIHPIPFVSIAAGYAMD